MRPFMIVLVLCVGTTSWACEQRVNSLNVELIKAAVKDVLDQQQSAWNQGDIEKYLEGYQRSDSLRFASGGNVHYGWQALLERYKNRYPDRAAMGILTFSNRSVTVLSADAALVFGKWQLDRENDVPYGYFTLLFRNTVRGWKIVHDHTSSAENR